MICPTCRSEYRDGYTHCAECDVALVAEPPASAPVDVEATSSWRLLKTVDSEMEAELIRGYLEAEGVACELESLVFHAEPFTFGPLAKVRVWVLEEALTEARAKLANLGTGEPDVSPPPRS